MCCCCCPACLYVRQWEAGCLRLCTYSTCTQLAHTFPLSLPFLPRRQFETFSYLPPLTADQIAKQVDYIVSNGWTPCLEFAEEKQAYVSSESTVRFGPVTAVSVAG